MTQNLQKLFGEDRGVRGSQEQRENPAFVREDELRRLQRAVADALGTGGGAVPTGTGLYYVIGGVMELAALQIGAGLAVAAGFLETTAAGGGFGTSTIDFGAFPGASDTSLDVLGIGAIPATAVVHAWLQPAGTADHLADEHLVESLRVFAGNVVAGVGFTIYARNDSQLNEPLEYRNPSPAGPKGGSGNEAMPSVGGRATLIYGKWLVGWRWDPA
jgi:hypothetical protein